MNAEFVPRDQMPRIETGRPRRWVRIIEELATRPGEAVRISGDCVPQSKRPLDDIRRLLSDAAKSRDVDIEIHQDTPNNCVWAAIKEAP